MSSLHWGIYVRFRFPPWSVVVTLLQAVAYADDVVVQTESCSAMRCAHGGAAAAARFVLVISLANPRSRVLWTRHHNNLASGWRSSQLQKNSDTMG